MKTAYFDCFSGAGGDMIAAAMLDAGLDKEFLVKQLNTLAIDGLDIKVESVMQSGIAATRFNPSAPEQKHQRHLSDIVDIIKRSQISDKAKNDAIEVFTILARAECKIHGKPVDEIHFHEVGAIDSIIDIVTACIGFDTLKIDRIICSPLSVGSGAINIAHGLLPAPAPATVEILKNADAPAIGGPVCAELLTPTAAAIFAHFADEYSPLPAMVIDSVGYGAGTKQFEQIPNILRIIIGTESSSGNTQKDSICLIETNVDDVTGEIIGFFTEKLLNSGALDVYTTPIYMKKGRPGVNISAICSHELAAAIENLFFQEGITLGVRKQVIERTILKRNSISVSTIYGEIDIKTAASDAEIISVKPEFADCKKAAQKHGVSVMKVKQEAMAAFRAINYGNNVVT